MDVDEVAYPEGHSLWDQILVPNATTLTLQQLVEFLEAKHNLALQVCKRLVDRALPRWLECVAWSWPLWRHLLENVQRAPRALPPCHV